MTPTKDWNRAPNLDFGAHVWTWTLFSYGMSNACCICWRLLWTVRTAVYNVYSEQCIQTGGQLIHQKTEAAFPPCLFPAMRSKKLSSHSLKFLSGVATTIHQVLWLLSTNVSMSARIAHSVRITSVRPTTHSFPFPSWRPVFTTTVDDNTDYIYNHLFFFLFFQLFQDTLFSKWLTT